MSPLISPLPPDGTGAAPREGTLLHPSCFASVESRQPIEHIKRARRSAPILDTKSTHEP